MNTMIVTSSSHMRGAIQTLVDLLRTGKLDDLNPQFYIPEGDGPLETFLLERQLAVTTGDLPYWVQSGGEDQWLYNVKRIPKAVESFRSVCERNKVDRILTVGGQSPVSGIVSRLLKLPHVWWVNEAYSLKASKISFPAGWQYFGEAAAGLADTVLVPSESLRKVEYREVVGTRVDVVPAGVPNDLYQDIPVPGELTDILCVGTLIPEKGVEDLIDALELLKQRDVQARVVFVGDPYDEGYLRHLKRSCSERGLVSMVEFAGHQQDIEPWLKQSGVVCSASHAESFGRTLVEGMLAGRPVVATRCIGPESIVSEGETGRLVDVGDVPALAAALQELVSDRGLAGRMGVAGRQRAQQMFTADIAADRLNTLCQEVSFSAERSTGGLVAVWLKELEVSAPRILLGRKFKVYQWLMNLLRRKRL